MIFYFKICFYFEDLPDFAVSLCVTSSPDLVGSALIGMNFSVYFGTVPACLFLIIDDIIFRGNTLCSGQGSSDFPRLECVFGHVGGCVCPCACLCPCVCACVSV